ncbi:MAG: transposase [Bacillota bacterium]|nr:transposase [Bacillota bacterium]
MPRCARIKESHYIYHIICRSMSEIDLFRDPEDKQKYVDLLIKYKTMFNFKIYAYCLMDNHLHIMIYSNGADISRIMHGINQSYSQYYNRKYARHGHVFSDRFKSKVVNNDRYMFVLSLYIHNNARSLHGISSVHEYHFSSLAIYLGLRLDKDDLVDSSVILSRLSQDTLKAKSRYSFLIGRYNGDDETMDGEILNNIIEYRSEKVALSSNVSADDVVNYLGTLFSINGSNVHTKYIKDAISFKSVAVFIMRGLCDMTIKEICAYLGNISQSYISKLCYKGYLKVKLEHSGLIKDFLSFAESKQLGTAME